jgi:anti-sigma regulatory factor (Ser/Thr protein kinase)/predicted transcriptional regulator
MSLSETRRSEIKKAIVREIGLLRDGKTLKIKSIADSFGLTEQSVFRYLREMSAGGRIIIDDGDEKRHAYFLPSKELTFGLQISGCDINAAWNQRVKHEVSSLDDDKYRLCNFAFTEILKNASTHSGGKTALISLDVNEMRASMTIRDDGVGIFTRITEKLSLAEERLATVEIWRAGGGLSAVRDAVDALVIYADGIAVGDGGGFERRDALWAHRETGRGTTVMFTIITT